MASEAQLKAAKKWNDKHLKERYDRIQLLVPKGQREVIKQAAKAQNKSLNEYIAGLIFDDLNKKT